MGQDGKDRGQGPSLALIRSALDRVGAHLRTIMPSGAPSSAPSSANDVTARLMTALATFVGLGDFARAAAQVSDEERHGLRVAFLFVDSAGAPVAAADWGDREVAWLTLTVTHVRLALDDGGAPPPVLRVDMDRDGAVVVRTRSRGSHPDLGEPQPAFEHRPFPGPDEAVAALPGLLASISFGPEYVHLLTSGPPPLGGVQVGDTAHWVDTRASRARAAPAAPG